jgi:hypothetical protein
MGKTQRVLNTIEHTDEKDVRAKWLQTLLECSHASLEAQAGQTGHSPHVAGANPMQPRNRLTGGRRVRPFPSPVLIFSITYDSLSVLTCSF